MPIGAETRVLWGETLEFDEPARGRKERNGREGSKKEAGKLYVGKKEWSGARKKDVNRRWKKKSVKYVAGAIISSAMNN